MKKMRKFRNRFVSALVTGCLIQLIFCCASMAANSGELSVSNQQILVKMLRRGSLEIERSFSIVLEFTAADTSFDAELNLQLYIDPPLGMVLMDGKGSRRTLELNFTASEKPRKIVGMTIPLMVTEAVFPEDLRIIISPPGSELIDNRTRSSLELILSLVVMNQEAVFDIDALGFWSGRSPLSDSADLRYRQLPDSSQELKRAEVELTTYAELFKTVNPELNNYGSSSF